jgi:hypothetical protein
MKNILIRTFSALMIICALSFVACQKSSDEVPTPTEEPASTPPPAAP